MSIISTEIDTAGFYCCCRRRLYDIINYINLNLKLPISVDSSQLFYLYKKNQNEDITFDFFEHYDTTEDITINNYIIFDVDYQFIHYSKLDYNNLSPIIDKYFYPSKQILQIVDNMEKKYNINYNNTIGVYYRGTDKYTETPLSSFDEFYTKIKEINDLYVDNQIIIQTDTAQFIDYIKNKNLDNIIIFDENDTSYSNKGIHNEKSNIENYYDILNIFSIFLILSKCDYFICSSGNCSMWIALYRKNFKNVYQFLNKKFYDINVIFSIGHRCLSTEFLIKYNLHKFSSPFDNLIIDFETSLKNINEKFNNYFNDIIFTHHNENRIELVYKKNTNEIDNKFYKLLENNVYYKLDNYNNNYLIFNQNYLDDELKSLNLYEWNKICCFTYDFILDENICNKIKNRCERFNYIMNKYNETTALLYITKIIHCNCITDYMHKILDLKNLYNISCFIIIIIITNNYTNNQYYYEMQKCFFLIKNVEDFYTDHEKYQIDDMKNLKDFYYEYNTILKFFTFNLIEKNDI
jgi:hypothetical protein